MKATPHRMGMMVHDEQGKLLATIPHDVYEGLVKRDRGECMNPACVTVVCYYETKLAELEKELKGWKDGKHPSQLLDGCRLHERDERIKKLEESADWDVVNALAELNDWKSAHKELAEQLKTANDVIEEQHFEKEAVIQVLKEQLAEWISLDWIEDMISNAENEARKQNEAQKKIDLIDEVSNRGGNTPFKDYVGNPPQEV